MTGRLPPSASVAQATEGQKLSAPAALRNAVALTEVLTEVAPESGKALELASGTGQHIVAFAQALPQLIWQPTEIATDRLASINAYVAEAGLPNLRASLELDACQDGWSKTNAGQDLILCVNLLHLISTPAAHRLVAEAADALTASGVLMIYGPFCREGLLTSPGDARFDAQLRDADPDIGYKDTSDVECWIKESGLTVEKVQDMPANNLAFIARKPGA